MKILMVSSLYHPNIVGGAEKVAQFLAEGLQNHNIQTAVVCWDKFNHVDYVNGVKVHYVSIKNLYWPFGDKKPPRAVRLFWHLLDIYNPFMAKAFASIVDFEKPDLVHTHNIGGFSAAIWSEAKKMGLPLVHTIHDYYLMCPRTLMFKHDKNCSKPCLNCRLFSGFKKKLSFLVDHVVGVSDFALQRHCHYNYFANAKKSVIYNPVSIPSLESDTSLDLDSNIENKWRPKGKIAFGFIGRLDKVKGVELLLSEYSKICNNNARLFIAGTGKMAYVSYLRDTFKHPNITFLGFTDPDQFYRAIDILVVPSLWNEPLPLVVLEALSHSIPVVAARRGGIPEEIEDGKSGFLFEPSKPYELTKILTTFIERPFLIKEMALSCHAKAKEFSDGKFLSQHMKIYQSLKK